MEKTPKINNDMNINNSSFSTRHSERISYNDRLNLQVNLNNICKKLAPHLKPEQQSLLQQEIAQIIIDSINTKDDCYKGFIYYKLTYLKKFVIKVLESKEKLNISINNESHNWFKDNIELYITEIDLENRSLVLAHAKEITLREYLPTLDFLMGITVDKSSLIRANGSNLFYSKPLIHMIHYVYQSSASFNNFCKTYNKEKLHISMTKHQEMFYQDELTRNEFMAKLAEDELVYIRLFNLRHLYITDISLFENMYTCSKKILIHPNPQELLKDYFDTIYVLNLPFFEALCQQQPAQTPQHIYTFWYYTHITLTSIVCIEKYRIPFYQLINKCLLKEKIDTSGERLVFKGILNLFIENNDHNEIAHKLNNKALLVLEDWRIIFDYYYLNCRSKKSIKLSQTFKNLAAKDLTVGETIDWYGLFFDLSIFYPEVFTTLLPEYYYHSNISVFEELTTLGKELIKRFVIYIKKD